MCLLNPVEYRVNGKEAKEREEGRKGTAPSAFGMIRERREIRSEFAFLWSSGTTEVVVLSD